MKEQYYVRNKKAGYLGNAPLWWGKNGQGYTAYILGAERFSKEDAEKLVAEDPEKFAMYKCADIDERLHLVYDAQDNEKLGTNAPCGWPGGYARILPAEPEKNVLEAMESAYNLRAIAGGMKNPLTETLEWLNSYEDKFKDYYFDGTDGSTFIKILRATIRTAQQQELPEIDLKALKREVFTAHLRDACGGCEETIQETLEQEEYGYQHGGEESVSEAIDYLYQHGYLHSKPEPKEDAEAALRMLGDSSSLDDIERNRLETIIRQHLRGAK